MAVLSNFGFLFLWLGQITSQLADRIFVYVLMIIIYELTKSNLGVSLPLLAFGIPSVLIAPWAGVMADKLDRKWIMVISDVVRGLLILLIIPLISKSVGLIFLMSLLIYSAAQFFAPAESSSIPELVDKKNLIVANSLFMITWMASSIVGFGLGAPLVGLLNETGTFVAAAVFYFISAAAILLVPLRYREPAASKKGKNAWQDLAVAFEFIRRNQIIRYSLYKLFVATSAIAVLSLLAISYAGKVLMIGEKNFGYLIIAAGVGMIIGMATLERLRHYLKLGTIVVMSFLFSGMFLLMLSNTADFRLAAFIIMLLGAGNIYITSSIQTILQSKIPRQLRGRVFGVQNMLINSAFTLPVVFFGLVADIWGILFSIAFLGWIVFFMGVAGIFLPKFRTA
ncbi:MAG: major facilitator superfamily protein [Candidatus Saganbacteria bacterium]|uniref:Major facilitator superfamily protein n=1 Tax=Candidatus Saganbacteria bacterium TaxID=2575572 RepID=A0A833L129_UNCSA|nr:MAG: major facilitator superfamily protein [Candidatus Saganbacteria bacterium]